VDPDRDAEMVAARSATLEDALSRVRLDGAFFLRAEYTEGWSYESPPACDLADLLRPGRERLVLFHIIATGRCWIAVEGGERHWAETGDVVVLPYGDQHRMGGTTEARCVAIASLVEDSPAGEFPVIRHGKGGPRTDVVCGYLESEDPLFDPALRALPSVFVVHPPASAAAWVDASIRYVLEASATSRGDTAVTTRLPELLLIEALRLHLDTTPAADHGWLGALHDPILAAALTHIHQAPERRWTVSDLAAATWVSRSLLDERFRQFLGRSPIQYLREWRMHVAKELLATTTLSVHEVARRVGYDAEEAFSRAFKRTLGVAPSYWRAEQVAGSP
jgi:AraC-like DNA-binding protein